MFILEAPYASDLMLDWLEGSQHPVLENGFARQLVDQGRCLNLVDDEAAIQRANAGERVYSSSENGLAWVVENVRNENLLRCIRLCKDKAETRRALAGIDTAHFFLECTMDELLSIDPTSLSFPLVVKPAVGFISFGVHVIPTADAWDGVISQFKSEMERGSVHPESVVGTGRFVLEGYLSGQEYAVDIYFDAQGMPVILNIMQHDFRDVSDTSDHLYFTGKDIIERAEPHLRAWFERANEVFGFRDFCAHVELRVSHAEGEDPICAMADIANVHAIELNPLRFAGFCGTDMGYYAFGIRTYEYFLNDQRPDWEAIFSDDYPDAVTAMSVLDAPAGWHAGCAIDFDAIECAMTAGGTLENIFELRKLDPDVHGVSCFPLYRIPEGHAGERIRDFVLNFNADEFLIEPSA
ncbi:MAG: ATP-grasp domain-containing protein [Eggerthellaceae bacterium]|nr:ATP-grasp domain-containing protein [Eggerthellaceae bacterium]